MGRQPNKKNALKMTVCSEEPREKCSDMAAAIGRREPYHLTYLKQYGQVKPIENAINTR